MTDILSASNFLAALALVVSFCLPLYLHNKQNNFINREKLLSELQNARNILNKFWRESTNDFKIDYAELEDSFGIAQTNFETILSNCRFNAAKHRKIQILSATFFNYTYYEHDYNERFKDKLKILQIKANIAQTHKEMADIINKV